MYFCSQFPDDVPDEILGQMGNRFQHALRAFTPRDQKAVKTAAETFVANPGLDVAAAIGQLGVGEALVSTLQDKGVPMPVEKTLVAPPRCRMGAITEAERAQVRAGSPVGMKYDNRIDRDSAAELLAKKAEAKATEAQAKTVFPSQLAGDKGELAEECADVSLVLKDLCHVAHVDLPVEEIAKWAGSQRSSSGLARAEPSTRLSRISRIDDGYLRSQSESSPGHC